MSWWRSKPAQPSVPDLPIAAPNPSEDDIVVTREIKAAADLLHIALHDHIIVGNGRWFSLRSNGML